MEEHQEYCEKKAYPIIEKLVTATLVERPELPVPFMVHWLAKEFQREIPTRQQLLQVEIRELKAEIDELEARYNRVLPGLGGTIASPQAAHDGPWVFCFGPDLGREALGKHGIEWLVSTNVTVTGWRLSFSLKGIPMVEPAYANIVRGTSADEIHGLAFQVSERDTRKLDSLVPSFRRAEADFTTYTNMGLKGFLYTAKPGAVADEQAPSQRYLDVLAQWARDHGVAAPCVTELLCTKTYRASEKTVGLRSTLPEVKDLDVYTADELSDLEEEAHVAVMGYVIRFPRARMHVGSHRNRDVTARVLREFRGQAPAKGEAEGRPPYPKLASMTKEEAEYIAQWLDHYLWAAGGARGVIGYLEEFRRQREGETQEIQLQEQKQHLAKKLGKAK